MYLQYGGYAHADNEVWLNIGKQAKYGPRGTLEKETQRWDIMGSLTGDDEADLTTKIAALESAYSTPGQDLVFMGNNSSPTAHALSSAGTLSGTRVEKISWLPGNSGIWGSGTEYVFKRSYHIVVTADTLWSGNGLYLYQTTLSVTGTTGPKKVWMPSLTGVPQQQIVQAYTTQKIVQTGLVVGLEDYIAPDGPLFPAEYEHLDRRQSIRMSPQEVHPNKSLKYPWRWVYFFESPIVLAV